MTEISIIVPCYNQGKYISECLDSILAQTFIDYEVIIVNDGSTDETLNVVCSYIDKYHNFRLINQKNQGVVAARNYGISLASGKYIYPLDADDRIASDCLQVLYDAISSNKGDIITSRVAKFGDESGEMLFYPPNRWYLSLCNCLVNSALFRKSDFEKVGGYDGAFSLGIEDYDLWLNMVLRHSFKIYRVQKILFFYRIKNLLESRNKRQMNQYAFELKMQLLKKYPQMRFYKFFMKMLRLFYNYDLKDNQCRIKIFGITFYERCVSNNG